MRLAIFTDTFIPQINGVSYSLIKFADHLKQSDIPYLIFAPDYQGKRAESDNGFNVCSLAGYSLPIYPECRISRPQFAFVRNKLTDFAPDLIHLATPFTVGLSGLKAAKKMDLPRVAAYHTDFPEYLDYYKLGLLKGLAWRYFRWFHNQCLVNFCPSLEFQASLAGKGINNVRLWRNGVDCERFYPDLASDDLRHRYVEAGKFAFLYVGRLAPEKNLDILLEAFRQVRETYPKAHLVITGNGPSYNALTRQKPLGVSFTGYLTGNDLAAMYASCDAFVFPSITETSGMVILEAFASGLPAVAAYAGGVKEHVIDHHNGLTCRPLDAGDLAAKMIELLTDPALRNELAHNARRTAEKMSWRNIFKHILPQLQSLIS